MVASTSLSSSMHWLLVVAWLLTPMVGTTVALMRDQIEMSWGEEHSFSYMEGDGNDTLALCLDETRRGSAFHTREEFLYGRFEMDMKLVAGNSAGTVTTLYLVPDNVPWDNHDEVDMEFLGNVTGEPYTLHTNVFVNGLGHRVQQFQLWFDPTEDFHTYSIEWNPKHIIFSVDGMPIRDYRADPAGAKPFPSWQRMRLCGTLWSAEWATRGGQDKTDWTLAPFYAYYRNLRLTPCRPSPGVSWCRAEPPETTWFDQGLDAAAMRQARQEHMIYDYCVDPNIGKWFNDTGFPEECNSNY